MLTAVVGINWGDEGKGRMIDYLAESYDIIVRYQGGNNAGHTVINNKGKFVLNLMPSGIFQGEAVNVLGPGMVIDLEHFYNETCALRERGVHIAPDNLIVSDKAVICLPVHREQDGLEEDRLGEKLQGSTRRGIAPAYADKYMRKALRMEDLYDFDTLKEKLAEFVEYKDLTMGGYGIRPLDKAGLFEWLLKYGAYVLPFLKDTGGYLSKAADDGKDILFEAQLGALRDIDYGIYPYTSSSTTLAAYAPIGAGIPAYRPDKVIGVMKAFSSSVGGGPFVAELFGEEASALREAGAEYGAATGRPRRVGGFDVLASAYGVTVQGANILALTKLDILRGMEKIPLCVTYEINGKRVERFPSTADLCRAKPIIEFHEGFEEDISGVRKFGGLPASVQKYVKYIEESVRCPIGYVSVGARRDEIIII